MSTAKVKVAMAKKTKNIIITIIAVVIVVGASVATYEVIVNSDNNYGSDNFQVLFYSSDNLHYQQIG